MQLKDKIKEDGVHAALANVLDLQEQIKEQAKQRFDNIKEKITILEKKEKELHKKMQDIKYVISKTNIYGKRVKYQEELLGVEKEYTDIVKDLRLHQEAIEIFKVKGLVNEN